MRHPVVAINSNQVIAEIQRLGALVRKDLRIAQTDPSPRERVLAILRARQFVPGVRALVILLKEYLQDDDDEWQLLRSLSDELKRVERRVVRRGFLWRIFRPFDGIGTSE